MQVGLFGERKMLGNVASVGNAVSRCFKFTIVSKDSTVISLGWFQACLLSLQNWKLKMLVFVDGGKPENPQKKSWSEVRTTTNSTHVWHRAGMELETADRRRALPLLRNPYSLVHV